MKAQTAFTLTLLTTLTLAAAQGTGGSSMPGSSMPGSSMPRSSMQQMPMSGSGAPMLRFTMNPSMNMMMGNGVMMVMPAPGMGRYTYRISGHMATLMYANRNAKGLFDFYDRAIRSEGWKEDMSMGMGMMQGGRYAKSYMMGKYKLDLMAMPRGNQTTVTIKTH